MISITIPLILFLCCMPTNLFGTMLPLEVIEITQHHQHHPQQQQQQQQQQEQQQQQNQQEHYQQSLQKHSTQIMYSNNNNNNNTNSSESSALSGVIDSDSSRSNWNVLLKPILNGSTIGNSINSNSIIQSITNTINSKNIKNNSISDSNGSIISNTNNINNDNKHKSVYNHHSERRRSRQMLEMLQPQPQGTRILYQVGNSEDDLPICAPNAVCSKIDLYETPWIERQCKCPDTNTMQTKSQQVIIHHKDINNPFYEQKYKHIFDNANRNYQHKRFENLHLKRLMHKLDAVFQDDIMLEENDFRDNNEELSNNNPYHSHRNDFNLGMSKEFRIKSHEASKLRHSAHRRDFPQINGCSSSLGIEDGHTIADKTRHYKLCNPVHKLPVCKYFRDYTWSLSSSPEMNITEQIVHCRCPKNSITYLTKREPFPSGSPGYTYLFACSPQSRLRCQRKEPCKLFTVRKRQEFLDEVNTNPLCQCPKGHRCPKHHTDSGVIAGKTYIEDNIQTYSGYCMAND